MAASSSFALGFVVEIDGPRTRFLGKQLFTSREPQSVQNSNSSAHPSISAIHVGRRTKAACFEMSSWPPFAWTPRGIMTELWRIDPPIFPPQAQPPSFVPLLPSSVSCQFEFLHNARPMCGTSEDISYSKCLYITAQNVKDE